MLAITGGKGGCGKTTTAFGLARALTRAGANTLLVDADTDCPDVHLLADVDYEPTWDALTSGAALDCVCQRAPSVAGTAVLPAGSGENRSRALEAARQWPGPVLVDCPAGAGPGAIAPLRVADRTVLATTDDPETLADTAKTARVARRVGAAPIATALRTSQEPPKLPLDWSYIECVPRVALEQSPRRAIDVVLSHPGVAAAYNTLGDFLWREWDKIGSQQRMEFKR